MPVSLTPLGPEIAVEIGGVNLSDPIGAATVDAIREAWLEYLVVVIRGQSPSDRELASFSRRFGELGGVPGWEDYHAPGVPEVLVISNVAEDGEPIGVLGAGEAAWHTDMSYLPDPPMASLLHALEVPPAGGDTYFMNMYAALGTLPLELRQRLEGRELNHDDSYASDGRLRPGRAPVTDVSNASGAQHPAVLVHPETGREALYLGRRLNAHIVGETVAESDATLDAIWATAQAADIVYRHRWRVGDVVMWDNRCTMHRRDPFDDRARRVMHRTQISRPPVAT